MEENVSGVVFSYSENVAIIKPTQTLEDWQEERKTASVFDIANGGYPAQIKSLAKTQKLETD